MATINSKWAKDTAPPLIARWENHAAHAKTDEAAQVQLTYELLLQVRVIKLLLFWVLVILPIIAIVVTAVLAGASEPSSSF